MLPKATTPPHPVLQQEKFVEGAEETQLWVDAQRVRISCQDPFSNLAWSPWSTWQDLNATLQRQI